MDEGEVQLKADACKFRPEVGKMKCLKNPKNSVDCPRYSSNKNIILVSLDKYFGDTANVKFGRFTASTRSLFRASKPGYEKTTISQVSFPTSSPGLFP